MKKAIIMIFKSKILHNKKYRYHYQTRMSE